MIFLGLNFPQVLACSCVSQFSQSFNYSDFVGHIKFKEIIKSTESHIDLKVETLNSYKGPNISTFRIYLDEFCPSIDPIIGDELIVFSRIDEFNNFSIGACSLTFNPNSDFRKTDLKALHVLKKFNLKNVQEFEIDFENDFFSQSWGIEIDNPEKDFAIYEVTYDRLNFLIEARVLESFGTKTDEKLISLIKHSDWKFFHMYPEFSPQLFKFLIIMEKEKWKDREVTKYDYM